MPQFNHIDKSLFHFSFLRDIKVHGIYYNSISSYLSLYPYIIREHYHDFYSVFLFNKGNGIIRVNHDSHKVHPQSVCLIAPNQMHSFEGLEDIQGIVFLFCQDFYVEEFSYIRLLNAFSCTSGMFRIVCNPCIKLTDKDFSIVNDLIKSIGHEYEEYTSSNNSSIIIRSLLNIMLLKLTELYDEESVKYVNGERVLIHELSRLVDLYFFEEHHISFYSSALNLSEKQMNDLCNRHFHCGLKKILTDRLMQEARKLLISSELSVSEISYKLKFDDNSYFNRVFKKQTGLTPKRFREIHKKLVP